MKANILLCSAGLLTGALCAVQEARAQSCKQFVDCGSGFATIEVDSNFGDTVGIQVKNTSNNSPNYGILISSNSGYGVSASSVSGVAVLAVSSTSNAVIAQNSRTDWNAAAIAALPGNSNGLAIFAGGGAEKPGGGSWSSTSDARVKKDVQEFRAGLAEIKRVRPVSYKYNGLGGTQDDGNQFVGVIAQELEKVLPEMVKSRKVKLHSGDAEETDLKRVDPSSFTYVLINAVQEQQKIIERQESRIAKLEAGRAPLISSRLVGDFGLGGVALSLVPLGMMVTRRRASRRIGTTDGPDSSSMK